VKIIRKVRKVFEKLPWFEKRLEANNKLQQLENFVTQKNELVNSGEEDIAKI
jgi:hypothetical protein